MRMKKRELWTLRSIYDTYIYVDMWGLEKCLLIYGAKNFIGNNEFAATI